MDTVADLTEDELIASMLPLLPRGDRTVVPAGDDAAVVEAPDGRFCTTTDVLVEDRHFRRDWGEASDVGWRAAAQNLADVAAMGAEPTSLVVSLVLPEATSVDWVHDLCRGMAEICGPIGVGVVGGDLSGGQQLVVAVTAHGDLGGRPAVLRSGARPGDVLAHAGVLGAAAGGYALLEAGVHAGGGQALVSAFLRPAPPLAAGPRAAAAGASALMDVSDGLLRDAGRMARASAVVLDVDDLAATVPGDLERLADAATRTGQDPVRWMLTGGEDHGLLAAFPGDVRLPDGFRRIGTVREPADHRAGTVLVRGAAPDVGATGWDHFRA